MNYAKLSQILVSSLALSGCLLTILPTIVRADGNPGLVIFSGVDERKNILDYHLDFGGEPGGWDRYRLYIPGKKLSEGATKFYVTYPDYYQGTFNPDSIEVRIDDEPLPLHAVNWDKESRIIEIELENALTATRDVEIVMSNVKNPTFGGTFYFTCQAMAAGSVPVRLYLGTWILTIDR
jgi:Protein of unknown function (DUF2808)